MGNHIDDTAQSITPKGSPGSFRFFLEATLMSSPVLLGIFFHVQWLEAPNARPKLHVILCASFKILFLPASVEMPD